MHLYFLGSVSQKAKARATRFEEVCMSSSRGKELQQSGRCEFARLRDQRCFEVVTGKAIKPLGHTERVDTLATQ